MGKIMDFIVALLGIIIGIFGAVVVSFFIVWLFNGCPI